MMIPINVTITEQMHTRLTKHKTETGLTLSELVRRSLDCFFNVQTTQPNQPLSVVSEPSDKGA